MQYWTKTKPSEPGNYYIKDGENVFIGKVLFYKGHLHLDCSTNEAKYITLKSSYFSDYEWGSAPLTEPAGRKM